MPSDSGAQGAEGDPCTNAPAGERVYFCLVCEWEYAEAEGLPDAGYPPGTAFEALGEEFECPECCSIKYWFRLRRA